MRDQKYLILSTPLKHIYRDIMIKVFKEMRTGDHERIKKGTETYYVINKDFKVYYNHKTKQIRYYYSNKELFVLMSYTTSNMNDIQLSVKSGMSSLDKNMQVYELFKKLHTTLEMKMNS